MTSAANILILGASGYTGAEAVRLLSAHPHIRIGGQTADRRAGESMGAVFPQLAHLDLPVLQSIDDVKFEDYDGVICGLPHATTQQVLANVPSTVKVADLSADFRLRDPATYEKWYGHPHQALERQGEAVYGLTEFYRDDIKGASLVACAGCYPTSALLPLVPLLEQKLIDTDPIVIDSKSGVTGAGRGVAEGKLYCEVSDGFHAYGVASHRHGPEIDQELSVAADADVVVTFTPHLVPMNRGMLSTIYVRGEADVCHKALTERFADEAFVQVLPFGQMPQTRHVRGSNLAVIGVVADRHSGRSIVISAIDNLVKGASGQGVQNLNLMLGFDETAGLDRFQPVFP